jgi:hypothetical protein
MTVSMAAWCRLVPVGRTPVRSITSPAGKTHRTAAAPSSAQSPIQKANECSGAVDIELDDHSLRQIVGKLEKKPLPTIRTRKSKSGRGPMVESQWRYTFMSAVGVDIGTDGGGVLLDGMSVQGTRSATIVVFASWMTISSGPTPCLVN